MPQTGDSTRNPVWEWLQVLLLGANLWWTTLCLGGYRPETMVVGSALTGALLLVHLLEGAIGGGPARVHPAGWFFIPFLAYAAANAAALTPVRWLGWHDWILWAQMIAIFWVVLNGIRTPRAQAALVVALLLLGVVASVLAVYQRFVRPDWLMLGRIQAEQFNGRSSGPFGIPNSLAAFLILVLPLAAVLALERTANPARRAAAAVLTAVLGFALLLTISRGAWLALAVALILWPILAPGRSWILRLGLSIGAAAILMGATAFLYRTSPGVRTRMDAFVQDGGERTRPLMWRAAWQIFLEHPWTGGGAGSYNVLMEEFRPENFQDEPQWAHNDYVNTLSDYGAVGILLFFGAAGALALRCACHRRAAPVPVRVQALAIGALAFSLQLFIDFLFKIPALGMAFAAAAALLVAHAWPAEEEAFAPASGTRRTDAAAAARAVCAAGVLAAMFLFVMPHFRSEAARYGVRRQIDAFAKEPATPEWEREVLARARASFAAATDIDPGNTQAWADRAYATSLWSRNSEERTASLGAEAEGFARRAIQQSAVVPEFWVRLGVALDMQGKWADAGEAFTQALKLAPNNGAIWFYQAYHFALQPAFRLIAQASVATSLRLDPGNRQAEALRQRLAAQK